MKTLRLPVPSPADPPRLDRFVVANVPELSRRVVKGLIDAGACRVDGRTERKAGRPLSPGQLVELDYRPSWRHGTHALSATDVVARGEGWWAVHKPAGVASHRPDASGPPALPELLAPLLDPAPERLQPAHRLDAGTSGLLLVAGDDEALARLSELFEAREVHKTYVAVVSPAPSAPGGELDGRDDEERPMHLSWRVLRRSGGRAELQVEPREGRTHQIRKLLAAAGWPIVGDLEYGRPLPGGAPRLALHCARLRWSEQDLECPPPDGWDALLTPAAPAAPRPEAPPRPRRAPSRRPKLQVSSASARILRGGHPWLVADRDTGDLRPLRDGDLVDLVDRRGDYVATAAMAPDEPVCGRVVSAEGGPLDEAWWREALDRALRSRRRVEADGRTTALRLVHREGDALPGLTLDRWGDVAVATRWSRCADAFKGLIYDELQRQRPELALYEQDHLEDLRSGKRAPADAALRGRWISAPRPVERGEVLEDGLRYAVEPLAGLTTGLYPDHRANRQRVARALGKRPGGRVLNLFGHIWAFLVVVAAAGADEAHTVDLASRYCAWTEDNLRLNGFDPAQHPSHVASSADFLARDTGPWRGAVVDPPAFARGRKGRGWNTRKDLRPLLVTLLERVEDGGWLLVSHNIKGAKRSWLRRELDAALRLSGRSARHVEGAPPGSDFPRLRGFPEGDSFQGLWVEL